MFPVLAPGAVERVETMGAVERPMLQPDGDLLPGADAKRFVVQGFVDASVPAGSGVTVAPMESFCLAARPGGFTFEALAMTRTTKSRRATSTGSRTFGSLLAARACRGL